MLVRFKDIDKSCFKNLMKLIHASRMLGQTSKCDAICEYIEDIFW